MLLLSMKTYLALVWGVSALFAMESMSDSVSETSNINSAAEPNKTTTQLISDHNETDTQSAMWNPTHKPAAGETEEPTIAYSSDSSDYSPKTAEAATATSSGQRSPHTSAGAITAAGEAQTSHSTAITGAAKPSEEQLHEQSPPTSISITYSAASSATETVSLPEPSSTTKPEVASNLSSTASPVDSTQTPAVTQNLNSTSASITSTGNPTSEGAPYSPVTLRETSTNSTELSSTSQPRSVTTFSQVVFSNTSGSKLLIPTTKSTTTASTDGQPCSTRAMVKNCLIVITSLAGLATIFMVSTIILCAKLSTRKYKVKKPQQATEMMSISALLPEMNYSHLRQRNPVTNGVLVMHSSADSDEDGGDNLTLSSFLPENDRFV